ncbi:hypothetical protein RB595_001625 [Gaeumannomyces hyphopodioides]
MPSPATKMLNYIRRPDPKGNSAPGSPRAVSHDMTQQAHNQQMQQRQQQQPQEAQHLQHKQLPQQPTPPHTQQQQQQAQPQRNQPHQQRALAPAHFSPPRAASRQTTFESAKLPIPKLARHTLNQPVSAPATTHSFGLHQRANSDGSRVHAPPPDANATAAARGQHDAWEDSTVNSLLESEAHSVTGHIRRPAVVAYEPRPPPTSALPAPPRRLQPVKSEPVKVQHPSTSDLDRPPFVFGDGGLLKVVDHTRGPGPSVTTLDSSVQSGILAETGQTVEDPYADNTDPETTPKKPEHPLKHSKLSIRHNRDVSRDTQDSRDKRASSVYSRQDRRFNGSPEPYNRARDDIGRFRMDSDTMGLVHQHSTHFYGIDPPGQRAAPEDDDNMSDPPSQGEEVTVTLNSRPPNGQLPASPTKATSKTRQPPPAAQVVNGVRPVSTTRTNSNHGKLAPLPPAKKRRMSLDYDDHMLHRMSYSELRSEPFDHDPARTTAQPAKQPSSGDSLTERLEHYQDQDENAQHQFFSQVSVAEWDECGDWFLERFGEVVGKIKKARRDKRKITTQYEEQVSAREELIRGKMEYIDRTLFSLKQEGEVMMKGKEVDL